MDLDIPGVLLALAGAAAARSATIALAHPLAFLTELGHHRHATSLVGGRASRGAAETTLGGAGASLRGGRFWG